MFCDAWIVGSDSRTVIGDDGTVVRNCVDKSHRGGQVFTKPVTDLDGQVPQINGVCTALDGSYVLATTLGLYVKPVSIDEAPRAIGNLPALTSICRAVKSACIVVSDVHGQLHDVYPNTAIQPSTRRCKHVPVAMVATTSGWIIALCKGNLIHVVPPSASKQRAREISLPRTDQFCSYECVYEDCNIKAYHSRPVAKNVVGADREWWGDYKNITMYDASQRLVAVVNDRLVALVRLPECCAAAFA